MTTSDSFHLLLGQIGRDLGFVNDTLALVGLFYTGKLSFKLMENSIQAIRTYFFPIIFPNEKWLKSLGNWAIVTGCDHGIGLAYANELAKKGLNLILVSRNIGLLQKLALIFERNYEIETLIIAVDVNEPGSLEIIKGTILEKDIGLLVNNVHYALEYTEFHKNTESDIEKTINVNIKAMVFLTSVVLPQMLSKNKGAIVNVSSGITSIPATHNVLYASTKYFVDRFTKSLNEEYATTNLVFQCLNPFLVKTKSTTKIFGANGMYGCNAVQYAKSAVRMLGYSKQSCGYWLHSLVYVVVSSMPVIVTNLMIKTVFQINNRRKKTQDIYDDFDMILKDLK